MEERYLGLNGQRINKEDIPFTENIEEHEMIENKYGDFLIYRGNQYDYVTADPTKFLSNNQIFSQWKKVN